MNVFHSSLLGLRKLLFLSVLFLVLSCGSSGGSDDDEDGPSDTVGDVSAQMVDIISSIAAGLSGVGGSSEALSGLLDLVSLALVDNGDQGLTDDLNAFIEDLLDPSTADISQEGDVITILPSALPFCNNLAIQLGIAQGSDEYNHCLQILAEIQVVIAMSASNAGDLTLEHESNTFIMLQYSEAELVVTINLADLLVAYNSMVNDPADEIPQPDTLTGEIVLTLTELGVDHGSIQLDISEAIDIQDISEGVDIAYATSTPFFAEADGVAGEGMVTGELNAISALYPIEIDEMGNEEGASLLMAAGTELTLNVTDGGAGVDGIVTVGDLNFDIDSQDQLDFLLDPGFSVNPGTGLITLQSELIMNLNYGNTFGLFGYNGALDILAPEGATFLELSGSSPFDAVYQVQTGEISFAGTGDFASYTDTISAGDCFNIDGRTSCTLPTECENVSGTWDWAVTNVTSPLCGPEGNWNEEVDLAQTGCSLVVTNFENSLAVITGGVDGSMVTIGPFPQQDGIGVTTSTFSMILVANGLTMSGDESWTWTDGMGGNCGAGTANIDAVKQ